MGALIILFGFFLLFSGHDTCPELRPEVITTPIYEPGEIHGYTQEGDTIYFEYTPEGVWIGENMSTATVTIVSISGELLVQVGTETATSTENIEHNKRVKECLTARGEF